MHQRLFEITMLLMRGRSATAAALAKRFGVSTRTIYRDIDALSAAGVPVYTERGKGGGIRLLPEYVLDKNLFTKSEQAQLVAYFDSLSALGAPDVQPVLDKLAALFGRGPSWMEVDYAPWGSGEALRPLFQTLQNAILNHEVLGFSYLGSSGERTLREVDPYKVVFRGQGWYLHGFCRLRGAFRFFKLSRMHGTAATGTYFAPLAAPPPWQQPYTGATVEVELRLSPALAHRAYDEFAPSQITAAPGGAIDVRCLFPAEGGWLIGYLLSFGPGALVLGPPALRKEMSEVLSNMQAQYQP